MFASRLGILERLISISRHILWLRIINGLLRDVGAMEPWRLRGSFFPLRLHKHFVLVWSSMMPFSSLPTTCTRSL